MTSEEKSSIICKANYKSNCHNCPLRPVCVKHIGPGWEEFLKWENDLNTLADKIYAEQFENAGQFNSGVIRPKKEIGQ